MWLTFPDTQSGPVAMLAKPFQSIDFQDPEPEADSQYLRYRFTCALHGLL